MPERVNEAPCRVSIEGLEELTQIWHDPQSGLPWTCPFVLPPWLNAWWRVFGRGARPLIVVVRQGETIAGIAPLMLEGKTVRFLGDPDVCDYFDCIVIPGKERLFSKAMVAYLSAQGFKELDLGPVRPESAVRKFFSESEPPGCGQWCIREEDVASELALPGTWDAFLDGLDGKQRHEIRRKLRRLYEAGPVRFRKVEETTLVPEAIETFLGLFTMNREDKAAFMTGRRASFFRTLSLALAEEGMLRLFFLDLDGKPVASVFCFDHQDTRYLYNNGYDDAYQGISVGLMSKVLSLKEAIDDGLRAYNFLKGGEAYKHRLGGGEIPLARCLMALY